MTAPALNLAQIAAPGAAGPSGPTAAAGAQAGGPLTGFDALIAALFPAPGTTTPNAATAASDAGPDDGTDLNTGEDAALDAAATLAAAVALQAPPAVDTAAAPAGEIAATSQAPAPADAKGHRAFGLAAAGLPPGQAHRDEVSVDSVDGGADPEPASAPAIKAEPQADKPAPPAYGRDKAQGAPAPPALENANPKADLAAKVAAAADDAEMPATPPPVEAAPAADGTPTEPATAPALTAQVTRPEPSPAPARPAKTERGVLAAKPAETAEAATPPAEDSADKPVQAKGVQAAAKPAADAVDAVEPKAGEAKPDADRPDPAVQAETRAAPQSSAVATHTAHAVRGSPETVASLAAQIVKKLEAKTTRFDVELDPAGLGRVDVRVEIGAHGKMTAAMVFESPQAAHELKSRAAELQRALEQAGFDLTGGLSFDVADQGRHQGQAWQDEAESGFGFRGQAFRAALETAGEAADAANTGALGLRRGVNAGVDVRI